TENNESLPANESVEEGSENSAGLEEASVEGKVIDSKTSNELVVPPQATALDLVERGNIDFTGDMSLNIPLLTVNGRNGLDLPLVAHYKSGVKVKQEASWIGLGWDLEIGSVTRIPLNIYDFNPSWNGSIYENGADPIPDAYLVSTPFGSRKVYNYAYEPGNPGYAHQNPKFMSTAKYLPEDLEGEVVSLGHDAYDFSKFIYYAEDGTRYVYGLALRSNGIDYYSNGNMSIYHPEAWTPRNTKWLLTAILSPDYVDATGDLNPLNSPNPATDNKGNWIAVEYYPVKQYHYAFNFDWYEYQANPDTYSPPISLREMTYPYRIVTPTHVAEFTLEDEFQGETMYSYITLSEWSYGEDGDYTMKEKLKRLKEVKLYNYSGSGSNPSGGSISEAEFQYLPESSSLGECNNDPIYSATAKKTTLEKIIIKSSGATSELPAYEFEYNSTPVVPCTGIFGLEHRNEDIFGYYCLRTDCYNVGYASSYSVGDSGSLKKIYYPNGAVQEFFYSDDSFSHNFGSGERTYFFGGVQVYKITITDVEGNAYDYRYSYGDGAISGVPVKWKKYSHGLFYDPQYDPDNNDKYYPFLEDDSLFYVYYPQVTEQVPWPNGNIRRNYSYAPPNTNYTIQNTILNLGDWSVNGGDNPNNGWPFELVMYSSADDDGLRGMIEKEAYYDQSWNLIKENDYEYNRWGLQSENRYFGSSGQYTLYSSYSKQLYKTTETEYDVLNPPNYSRTIEERWYDNINAYYSNWNDAKVLSNIDTYKEGSNHKIVYIFYPLASDFLSRYYVLARQKHMYSQPDETSIQDVYNDVYGVYKKWRKYEYTGYDGERLYLWKERERAKVYEDEWIETIYSDYDDYGNIG
ncbi:hypothetical protein KJ660_01575, partial [Candidatus Micrarchaeota archaeon]|nr:hypothetical protein [Candidatus Micrarchaeota archaeon]